MAYVTFDGRFDHILANVNTLYIGGQISQLPLYLLNETAVACLLPAVSDKRLKGLDKRSASAGSLLSQRKAI